MRPPADAPARAACHRGGISVTVSLASGAARHRHVYIRPRTPHLNGKVERSHRVDDQDQDGISDNITLFNSQLREWEDYYNYHRPHGGLDGQTPYERLLARTRATVSPRS